VATEMGLVVFTEKYQITVKLKGIERQIEQRISNFNKKSYSQSNFGDKRKKMFM